MSGSEQDRAEIIALIHANRIAMWTQDHELYQQCFVHEPYTTRWGWWPRRQLRAPWLGRDSGAGAGAIREPRIFNNAANAYDTQVGI